MTPIADMIEAMLEQGASLVAILIAVRAVELRDASRHASRSVTILNRSKAALRAERYRQNRKQNQASAKANDVAMADAQGVTNERDASRDGVTAHCDLSSSFLSQSGIREEQEGKKQTEIVALAPRKNVSRGTRMQGDAALSADDAAFAFDQGMTHGAIDKAWAEFKDYWIAIPGQRGTKLDWSATWRNRVRQIAGKGPANGRKGGQPSFSEIEHTLREQIHAATFEQPANHQPDDGRSEFDFDHTDAVPTG